MNVNFKKLYFLLAVFVLALSASAQQTEDFKYRRSSIYSVMINHTDQQFAKEIKDAFLQIPTPDKFNDHNLSIKILNMDNKLKGVKSEKENEQITKFLEDNKVASRLVARWFNRDKFTGVCDMNLVKTRGLYGYNEFDRVMSEKSVRSEALLMDAGEDLIGNTFVLVNDIRYIDKSKGSKTVGGILRVLGSIASAYTGVNFDDLTDDLADMAESLKGFKVKINTFLYRLEWNDDVAYPFYKDQYSGNPNDEKRINFENSRDKYRLKYVGKQESSGSTTSFLGIKEEEPVLMVRKACQRAIDENISNLQYSFEEFRTKSPLMSVMPLKALVGMKEGITENSRFEVLEVIEDENGSHEYNRVGIIKPVKNLIWDNRFMALEEGALNSTLGATTFEKVSGGEFAEGMLIKEIDSKK